jgi:hypothetical protein
MSETAEREYVPETVWDHYIGQRVCIQLKVDYVNVTAPGMFAQLAPGEFLRMPLLVGICGVQKDQQGNVRVTVLLKDPDSNKNTLIHTSLDPSAIFAISVAQGTEEESRIITP